MKNLDQNTVLGFGDEWKRFDQSVLSQNELDKIFELYFEIFPWKTLPKNAVGFDLGSGSGRWAKVVARRVGQLHCIDPAYDALEVCKKNLAGLSNCQFHLNGVSDIPLGDATMDFGYSLGVLHHIPDTLEGIKSCVKKLKPGAPFLLYLYYAFDNRPLWFKAVWKISDWMRSGISKTPFRLRYFISQLIAGGIYFPLARFSKLLESLGLDPNHLPLSFYRDKSFYTMRTDALDRFGTRLERRFTRAEIQEMMEASGLEKIEFSKQMPHWIAVGNKKSS